MTPQTLKAFVCLTFCIGSIIPCFGGERLTDRSEAAAAYAQRVRGQVVPTLGNSMEPLIHGAAFAVVVKEDYSGIKKGDLLVYMGRPDASKPNRVKMLHRAVMHDRYGWIMSGDNNRWSESWDRVTPDTYLGIVKAIF